MPGARKRRDACARHRRPLKARRWYRVWASYDGETGEATVGHLPLDEPGNPVRVSGSVGRTPARTIRDTILIAASGDGKASQHFNGKLEAPAIHANAINFSKAELGHEIGCIASWDFSKGISSLTVEDTGPNALHGEIVNLPARGMTGATWRGQEMCWRHAPEHYGAIHFHDDDFYDCAWQTDFSFEIPQT